MTSDQSGLREYFGPAHFGGWARRLADGDDLADVDPFTRWADAAFDETVEAVQSAAPALVLGGLATSGLAVRLAPALDVPPGVRQPRRVPHPHVIIDRVADVDPEQLEQLARSVAMSPSLTTADRQAVVVALRLLADLERARRRHPAGGSPRWPPGGQLGPSAGSPNPRKPLRE